MQLTFHLTLTNEEKRVAFNDHDGSPTLANSVTARTPLSDINLNWREKDLPERERTKHVHRLHPYLGKYIPQLVEVFLRKYFRAGQTVLDPFIGSGTTAEAAKRAGRYYLGIELSSEYVALAESLLSGQAEGWQTPSLEAAEQTGQAKPTQPLAIGLPF